MSRDDKNAAFVQVHHLLQDKHFVNNHRLCATNRRAPMEYLVTFVVPIV